MDWCTTSKKSGFILVLTMMLLSIMTLIVSQLFHQGTIYVHYDQAMINREKAKQLAYGGIQLAVSMLSIEMQKTTTQAAGADEKKQENPEKKLLQKILLSINQWQRFELHDQVDGLNGSVELYIACENGKLDINQLFDFEKKKFKGEGQPQADIRKILQELFAGMKKFTGDKDLFEVFEKFLKQRQYKLDDVTELITIPEFQNLFKTTIFYQPETPQKTGSPKKELFLTDIFTVSSGQMKMQPWLLSSAIQSILGLKKIDLGPAEKRDQRVAELTKDFKQVSSVQELWEKQLQVVYGKDLKSLPKQSELLLNTVFEPTVFSVISYGTVGTITQKLCAIIAKRKDIQHNREEITIKKLYWL